ncbi:MAG: response regulator transcription factor [Thermomicrobiales bacterium]|nr:response regulator transcription factor [Thermomicrobiales bacterium]
MTDEQPRILVVDDEENIRFLVTTALSLAGIDTVTAASGFEALDQIYRERPDLIVLDVMLPDLDGFALLRRLRDQGNETPIIFLTARDQSVDRVKGLSEGGDDYIVKPFDVAELVARVQLRLRKSDKAGANRRLRCADLEMDTDLHQVFRGGATIYLSPTEYKLLHYLLTNVGRVLNRSQILQHVWSYEVDVDQAVVDTYISYLRKKIDQTEPKLIHTVRGIGFTLRVDS